MNYNQKPLNRWIYMETSESKRVNSILNIGLIGANSLKLGGPYMIWQAKLYYTISVKIKDF